MKYLIPILLIVSCAKKPCTPSATCNDDRLEFGHKCEVCKGVGIKYYYGCKGQIINCWWRKETTILKHHSEKDEAERQRSLEVREIRIIVNTKDKEDNANTETK